MQEGRLLSCRRIREGLSGSVTFEQKSEKNERASHVGNQGKYVPIDNESISAVQQSDPVIHMYVCVYVYIDTHSFSHIIFHYVLSQETGYSFLYYIAGPHCLLLFILFLFFVFLGLHLWPMEVPRIGAKSEL